MKMTSKSGAAIAAAAATLFLAGATMSTVSYAAGEGHCIGANACKGQSACKGGNHSCKGQNACKGQGFSAMTRTSAKPPRASSSRRNAKAIRSEARCRPGLISVVI